MTTRTGPIKFTRTLVEEVAARVKEFTGGEFALQATGDDDGEGVRYFDAHVDRVWTGPKGARRAAAYYIGGALGTAQTTGRLIPEEDAAFLKRVQSAYQTNGPRADRADYATWEALGRERAERLATA